MLLLLMIVITFLEINEGWGYGNSGTSISLGDGQREARENFRGAKKGLGEMHAKHAK